METTQQLHNPPEKPEIVLTEEAQYYLQKTGHWANFIAIVGFIITGFIIVAAVLAGTLYTTLATLNPMVPYPAGVGIALSVFYGVFAIFNFFFSLYLYHFAGRIKKGILYNYTEDVTLAFSKLKSFFKLWGITVIVIISLYILIFIGVIIVGIGAASTMAR